MFVYALLLYTVNLLFFLCAPLLKKKGGGGGKGFLGIAIEFLETSFRSPNVDLTF